MEYLIEKEKEELKDEIYLNFFDFDGERIGKGEDPKKKKNYDIKVTKGMTNAVFVADDKNPDDSITVLFTDTNPS